MTPHLPIELEQTELWLLAEKAIYWPTQQALLIADIHFGKAAAYRRLGQPVPHGTTQANLQRLDALLARYNCHQLIFLGDFLHAPESQTPATLAQLHQWRATHPDLAITLIRGNHDRRAGDRSPCSTNPIRIPATMSSPATYTRRSASMAADGKACACRASASAHGSACCQRLAALPE
jgi:DNA ligase-associated metallophosphoesterase